MFKKRVFNICRRIKPIAYFAGLYLLWRNGSYLREMGWFDSFSCKMPVNKRKQPLPWLTYAAISFLENRIKSEMVVFEYGSGNSTIWWSSRVAKVVSCEHDEKWYQLMKPKLSGNVEYLYFDLVSDGDYSKAILKYNAELDIIVIDGRDRVNCAKNSLKALKPTGVIIWDNSDREKYKEGYDYLLANGFKRLDFIGLGPIYFCGGCTSIFYRSSNCLGI